MSENELLQRCKRGDRQSQKALYNQYVNMAINICRRYARDEHEVKDFVQNAFVKAFTHLQQFDSQKGTFAQWFSHIVLREAIKGIQSNRLVFPDTDQQYIFDKPIHPTVLEALDAQEILDLIRAMPSGFRLVFNLFVIEGYTHKEITSLTNISESASRSRLIRARKWLQNRINAQNKCNNNGTQQTFCK